MFDVTYYKRIRMKTTNSGSLTPINSEPVQSMVLFYPTGRGEETIAVRVESESVWLTQQQLSELYQTVRSNLVHHIREIYAEGELQEADTCREVVVEQTEGTRTVKRPLKLYNLDVVIALGYRVKSPLATRFRQWATARLKEYVVKGFTMDDARLKELGGGGYWKELLERIRDIRSSEKVMYRQVLDLYATSMDYDPNSDLTRRFFTTVQNKLHYAAHGHTAAEVVYHRADADKPFMGLTTFKGPLPILSEVTVAKNYLTAEELGILNRLVSGYFDFAEIRAMRHEPVYMRDYVEQLDALLASSGQTVLEGAGRITHAQAKQKAEGEYRRFQEKTLSPVEVAYLETIRSAAQVAKLQLTRQRKATKKKPRSKPDA